MLLRVGRDLTTAPGSEITAKGGSGISLPAPPAAPGGGGSGGSILVQCGGAPALQGRLDTSGGTGSFSVERLIYFVETRGGDGAPGVVRLEVPQANPSAALLGATVPAATPNNVGTLADADTVVGCQSLWYASGLSQPPTWLRYEIEVDLAGTVRRLSDDATGYRFVLLFDRSVVQQTHVNSVKILFRG